jgi:rhomboid protease GluP
MLSQLDRRPAAYEQGEWWRWFTAILVYDEGWLQLVCNLSALALVGFWVERWYGRFRWLAFYGLGGLAGQAAGTFWQPYGAGASVAVCGLLGALCVWLVLRGQGLPRRVRIWGALGLFGAVWLCVIRDIHGPPVLVAAGLATVMLRRDRLPPASSSDRSGLRSGRASD